VLEGGDGADTLAGVFVRLPRRLKIRYATIFASAMSALLAPVSGG